MPRQPAAAPGMARRARPIGRGSPDCCQDRRRAGDRRLFDAGNADGRWRRARHERPVGIAQAVRQRRCRHGLRPAVHHGARAIPRQDMPRADPPRRGAAVFFFFFFFFFFFKKKKKKKKRQSHSNPSTKGPRHDRRAGTPPCCFGATTRATTHWVLDVAAMSGGMRASPKPQAEPGEHLTIFSWMWRDEEPTEPPPTVSQKAP